MDFDYKIFGQTIPNSSGSAKIYRNINKVEIFLHPNKCTDCGAFFNNIEGQMIDVLNHEVQESLMVKIMLDDTNTYKKEWYDKTARKIGGEQYKHKCRRSWFIVNNLILDGNGYIR